MKRVKRIRNNFLSLIIIALLFLLTGIACDSGSPLSIEKTSKIYVDLLIVKEKFGYNQDSLSYHQERVIKKAQTTIEDYNRSLKSYIEEEEKLDMFFQLAEDYLDSLKVRAD